MKYIDIKHNKSIATIKINHDKVNDVIEEYNRFSRIYRGENFKSFLDYYKKQNKDVDVKFMSLKAI